MITGGPATSSPGLPGRTIRLLHRLEEVVLVVTMAILVGVAATQIVLRNFFAFSLLWADPLVRHLVLWGGLVGALIATRQEKHIVIDGLVRVLPPRAQAWLAAVTAAIAAVVCAILTWVGARFIVDEYTYGLGGAFGVPAWVLQLLFPICFAGMAIRFAVRAWVRLGTARAGDAT